MGIESLERFGLGSAPDTPAVGASVAVRYNPDSPSEIAGTEAPQVQWWAIGFATICAGLAALLWLAKRGAGQAR
jgi:hypothetical protein